MRIFRTTHSHAVSGVERSGGGGAKSPKKKVHPLIINDATFEIEKPAPTIISHMLKSIRKKIRKTLTLNSGQLKPDTENVKTNFTTEEEQQVNFVALINTTPVLNTTQDTGAHEYEIEYNEEHDYEEDEDGGIQEVTPPPVTGVETMIEHRFLMHLS